MGRLLAPPTNGAADPYSPTQGTRGQVWWGNGWFACLGRQKETHQNRDMGVVLALSGQNFKVKRNNQKGVSGLGRRDVGEES